ncbi:MAG: hydroxymethylglutaryl-CoA reductase [Gammaproteobacteria bacterium]|nr:hydroxymethylglutaryl-CoA reductase [Gammaproteobacteria bacterium]
MNIAKIPMRAVGPVKIIIDSTPETVMVPLATFESPLWPSVNRGARVSRESAGIYVTLIDDRMTRSVIFKAPDAETALKIIQEAKNRKQELQAVIAQTSRFAKLLDIHFQIVGHLLYTRFEFFTGDASGHNMVTQSADSLMQWFLKAYPVLAYRSISGNYCTDKKVSAVNGILGRGKNVVAEMTIPRDICEKILKITPEQIVRINIEKNLIGSILSGSIRSANAHFANMLLAFYLATGQDAANIIEGSQGLVTAEICKTDLYFSVTLPNIIVGTVGNGKELDFVQENLKELGCLADVPPGDNAHRLAIIAAATVLCGELSLLASQTVPGELMRCHRVLERSAKTKKQKKRIEILNP